MAPSVHDDHDERAYPDLSPWKTCIPGQERDITDAHLQTTIHHAPSIVLEPMIPKMSTRYHDEFVPKINHFITPLLFCDPTSPYLGINGTLPDGWDKYIHPEGALYYVNHDHHIVTCSNVYDADVVAAIHEALKEIRRRMVTVLPEDCVERYIREYRQDVMASVTDWHRGLPEYELVLELDDENPEEGKPRFKYYCADWQRCCIFWLEQDPWEGPLLPSGAPREGFSVRSLGLDAQVSYDQLQLTLQSEFWRHVQFFPAHRDIPSDPLYELKITLKYMVLDRLSSRESTVTVPPDHLKDYMELFPEDDPRGRSFKNVYAGTLLSIFYADRCVNLYGTPHVRAVRTQSRYYEPHPEKPQTLIGRFLRAFAFVFLFDDPGSFYRKLCATWVDKTVLMNEWQSMMRDAQKEWDNFGFMATVILAANMAFLAIDQLGGDGGRLPLLPHVLSITSTLFSLGSIVSGIALKHQHRQCDIETCLAWEAADYMIALESRGTGLYSAAIVFSLPFGFFLWSLLLFIAGTLSLGFLSFSHVAIGFIVTFACIIATAICIQMWHCTGLKPPQRGSRWKRPSPAAEESERTLHNQRTLSMARVNYASLSAALGRCVGKVVNPIRKLAGRFSARGTYIAAGNDGQV